MRPIDQILDDTGLDAPWYEATYPDVALSGLTAVEHYRIIGQRLRRPARPERPQGRLADLVADVAIKSASTDREPQPTGSAGLPIIDAPGEATGPSAPTPLHRAGRAALSGLTSEADYTQTKRPVLEAFARLHGRRAADLFGLPGLTVDMLGQPFVVVGPDLCDGSFRIADLWFASATTLCLRLDLPETLPDGASLYLYQTDPLGDGVLVEVGAQMLIGKGQAFGEATLRNPLMPVLMELVDGQGRTKDLALLAFPSLARGGLHGAELVGLVDGQTTTETLWAYTEGRLATLLATPPERRLSRVLVSLRQAGGGEHVFSRAVAEWLGLFGLLIEPLPGTDESEWDRLGARQFMASGAGEDRPALVLPCEGLPTIAALTEPLGARRETAWPLVVPHLISDRTGNRPNWAVTLPSEQTDLGDLQRDSGALPMLLGADVPALPMAILYRDPRPFDAARALLPTMPDSTAPPSVAGPTADAILCVLDVSDVAAARLALTALSAQWGAEGMRLALTGSSAAVDVLEAGLAEVFANPVVELGPNPTLLDLLRAANDCDALLFLEDRVVMHDPRTVALLRSLLERDWVASAACVVLHESLRGQSSVVATESGGYVPSRVGLVGGPHLLFDRVDTAQALPNATYPVAANALSVALVARAAIDAAAGRLPGNRPLDDLGFGLTTHALGWRHLCTSVVRATSLRLSSGGERVDPVALRRIAPARWEDLLSEVTLLRELR